MVIYLTHTCSNQYLISIGSDGVSVFLFFHLVHASQLFFLLVTLRTTGPFQPFTNSSEICCPSTWRTQPHSGRNEPYKPPSLVHWYLGRNGQAGNPISASLLS